MWNDGGKILKDVIKIGNDNGKIEKDEGGMWIDIIYLNRSVIDPYILIVP